MKLVRDPAIATKIQKMKQRVHWQHQAVIQHNIDQTRFVLADEQSDNPEFSFLVLGDSGTGNHRGHDPQRQVAELLLQQRDQCRFILHTGDVVYLVGSREYYHRNFIKPYREFIVGGENPDAIAYDQMVFNFPFLPVPGNHDYYDLQPFYSLIAPLVVPLRRLLRSQIDLDVGWHGSYQGDAYARAFLDYLSNWQSDADLARHFQKYYTAKTPTGRCLSYQPGLFTRLPNRYYTYRYGGIDFFALDSTTFNAPAPIPKTAAGDTQRDQLNQRLRQLQWEQEQLVETIDQLNRDDPEQLEQIQDNQAKIEQIQEMQIDIEKTLNANESDEVVDWEQLNWLQQRLIDSWHTDEVRGRIIYFHHPPYVTEATKWQQAQTLAVRQNLRQVLDGVLAAVGERSGGRPLVDLVLNGHAHCLEYLQTHDTGHGDRHIPWIICGGSGYSLRRQRPEGPKIEENVETVNGVKSRVVAQSQCYIGRSGKGSDKHRPYSAIRIDVKPGNPPQFFVQPMLAEWHHHHWQYPKADGFQIG
jgi:hypothetical protein